jgi:CBS domain-containing protein
MQHLIIIFLDDLKCMPELLHAWQRIGVTGATIFNSTGSYRTTTWLSQVGLGALDLIFESKEINRRTLMAAIDHEDLLEKAIGEAERVVDFNRPESGVLVVLPVTHALGFAQYEPPEKYENLPQPIRSRWRVQRDTPIKEVVSILKLEPTTVRTDTPLDDVAKSMLSRPNTHVACVITSEGRLLGLIKLRRLADDLFFHIIPEEFLSEVIGLEDALEYADKSRMRTAADAMEDPLWVKPDETVKDAFERMHEHDLPGLPVVDDRYRVIGYINLLELLAVCLDTDTITGEGES